MKIQIITSSISRQAGGVLDAVKDLFSNKAFDTKSLSFLSYSDLYSDKDIKLWKGLDIKLFRPHFFLYNSDLKKEIQRSDADILHIEGLWRYPQLLINTWEKYHNRPVVCSPHGMLDPYIIYNQGCLKRFFAKVFLDSSLKKVSCFHALCRKELEDIRNYGITCPVAIIPNGINISQEEPSKTKIDDKKHLLYLGRLHHKKGVDLLLLAIAEVIKTNPTIFTQWHVDIVGWDDGGYMSTLEKIVADNDMKDIVTFHGGLYGKQKEEILSSCNAYILPSHGEGLPMSILEAWAWGLPVLMTDQCNIPEGFVGGAAIRISDNIQGVVEGLQKLFDLSDIELKVMGAKGRKLVEDNFTWEESAKKMILLYEWLIGKKEKPNFVF